MEWEVEKGDKYEKYIKKIINIIKFKFRYYKFC